MTLPDQRFHAVRWTEEFLMALIDPKQTPRVPKEIRRRAASLLKHYPSQFHMDMAASAAPDIFGTWDGKDPKEEKPT